MSLSFAEIRCKVAEWCENPPWENGGGGELLVETAAVYEYRDIWAEEGGGLANNSAQWSYGNGATGFIGLPIDAGWEVQGMYFHSDTGNTDVDLVLNLVDFQGPTPSVASPVIASLPVSVAAGDGFENNVYKYEEFATPVPVPTGAVLGFRTTEIAGNAADARVGARLCRKQGDFVTAVSLA